MDALIRQVVNLTVPCADDGCRFVCRDRLDIITTELEGSRYVLLDNRPLAYVYRHMEYDPAKPTLLISNHIDSLYDQYFASSVDGIIRGTLDNSACNAVAVDLIKRGALPPQALIAFTGDEEGDSAGVDQTIEILRTHGSTFWNLELAISLDLTEESYGCSDFTIENYFIESLHNDALLKFFRKRELKSYLNHILTNPTFVKDGEADESWQYDEYDLNCFTLCLPCALLGNDMHDDSGVMIRSDSLKAFASALQKVTSGVDKDLANKALHRTANRRR